jgi:hypothetical protein
LGACRRKKTGLAFCRVDKGEGVCSDQARKRWHGGRNDVKTPSASKFAVFGTATSQKFKGGCFEGF